MSTSIIQLQDYRRIHLIGIGGAGMSAIAGILLHRGHQVSGSDQAANATTRKLAEMGAIIYQGHQADNLKDVDLLVISTAIRKDNPELQAACERAIPMAHRSQVLAAIMHAGQAVAVSGTHGKTTTTSMLGLMLTEAGLDPTVLIGGELNDFGGNSRPGNGQWVVAEADESDGSLLNMLPDRIIVTNIEPDHLDYYKSIDDIYRTFNQFVSQLREGGKVIACLDDPAIARLTAQNAWPVISYGLECPMADMTAQDVSVTTCGCGSRFVPVWQGERLAPVELAVPGRHNVLNALGALACGLEIGADYNRMVQALAKYYGAKRRFQVKGQCGGITVVDDYAHHPTEIAATLKAARSRVQANAPGRVVGLFQPHRYSRTMHLAKDFGKALQDTDLLVVTDVYSAGEAPIEGVSGRSIYDRVLSGGHPNAHYLATLDETRQFLLGQLAEGDLLLTLGAGNVYTVGEALLQDLNQRIAS